MHVDIVFSQPGKWLRSNGERVHGPAIGGDRSTGELECLAPLHISELGEVQRKPREKDIVPLSEFTPDKWSPLVEPFRAFTELIALKQTQ